jgi:hypothetical protein
MNSVKRILVVLVCLLPYATVVAQERQSAMPSRGAAPPEVTVIIQQQQIRFTASASAQEIRLEVFDQAGERIYDSGPVSGTELTWALQKMDGEAVASGLYAYTFTVKEANVETPVQRRGHLILESGRDRLWVTSQGAIGAEAAMSGGELTASTGAEANVVGARIGNNLADNVSPGKLKGFETAGQIPVFTDANSLTNSVITQGLNGRIGIGTTRPTSALTVAGQIEVTSGGIKFPDGTTQMTSAAAALFQVNHNATMTGNGTSASPLGINIPALDILSAVAHDATMTGDGTSAAPLRVAVPLTLNNSAGADALTITSAFLSGLRVTGGAAGEAIDASAGGDGQSAIFARGAAGHGADIVLGLPGGAGVLATGGNSDINNGGDGVIAAGGKGGSSGLGGDGVRAIGGDSIIAVGGAGIEATGGFGPRNRGLAGLFNGDVTVSGNLSKAGGSFKIDHPLDPANKYLYHSFVESPDMMNIYNGAITTDQNGEATVTMPDYFEALNRDFRYQLTVIGQFAQAIVASKISGNRFTIKTDRPGVEVSWQVTGIRQDAYANKYRIPVEEEKPKRERGYYLHPEVFNQPEEKSLEWARNPELMRKLRRQREDADCQKQEKENDR